MSPSRKQARKQKKQQKRKQQKATSRAQTRRSVPAPHLPELSRSRARKAPDPETLSPIDRWWHDYGNADGHQRLQMTREKLKEVAPDDDWFESLFPEAVLELEPVIPESQYVDFLEFLCSEHPDIFALSADWHAHSMVLFYVSEGRLEEIDRVAEVLATSMESVSEPFFSLISMIRLAGRAEAAQRLIDAAMPRIRNSDLVPWAIDELIDLALYDRVQACIRAGVTDEAIEEVFQKSVSFGVNDTQENRALQRKHISHIAGTSGKDWSRDELLAAGANAGREIYCLLYHYMRWLCAEREFEPVIADELRRILAEAINHMQCKANALLRGLKRSDFEPALARKLNFLSLSHFHAPAIVLAMRHFYDFLHARDLVDARTCNTAHDVCYVLWRDLKKAMAKNWNKCRFLEAYQPNTTTGTTS